MDWAAYTQFNVAGKDTIKSFQLRFLEKQEKQWRIIFQQTDLVSFPAEPKWKNVENEFNNIGYALLQINKIPEAIKVFKINIEIFPESSNVYDSLGDAYWAANDKKNAASCFKKAVEKNPTNTISAEKLKKLL